MNDPIERRKRAHELASAMGIRLVTDGHPRESTVVDIIIALGDALHRIAELEGYREAADRAINEANPDFKGY